jgi:two-component sensor histidine kinase
VRLSAGVAQIIGMAIHELGTNAAKYGALSVPAGHVTIGWRLEENTFFMNWIESGVPAIKWPDKVGSVTVVIDRMTKMTLGGSVEMDRSPTGLACHLRCPSEKITPEEKCMRSSPIGSWQRSGN